MDNYIPTKEELELAEQRAMAAKVDALSEVDRKLMLKEVNDLLAPWVTKAFEFNVVINKLFAEYNGEGNITISESDTPEVVAGDIVSISNELLRAINTLSEGVTVESAGKVVELHFELLSYTIQALNQLAGLYPEVAASVAVYNNEVLDTLNITGLQRPDGTELMVVLDDDTVIEQAKVYDKYLGTDYSKQFTESLNEATA